MYKEESPVMMYVEQLKLRAKEFSFPFLFSENAR